MKRVYICHPLRGANWRENVENAARYCRQYVGQGVLPISPLHAFGFLDPNTYDAKHGMALCLSLLETCDEVWVYGAWEYSKGCQEEIMHAWSLGIPVKFITDEVVA